MWLYFSKLKKVHEFDSILPIYFSKTGLDSVGSEHYMHLVPASLAENAFVCNFVAFGYKRHTHEKKIYSLVA